MQVQMTHRRKVMLTRHKTLIYSPASGARIDRASFREDGTHERGGAPEEFFEAYSSAV